ncbi:MAG: tRNA (5-methylaminomethyl-2-thiouridine)(34)-methyltransferase MnmD [Bacteroidota bacterium]|nr:tRNA (5-methylaminomethyl-2-thiouridine)(34)-methyltransferase MnmD [Bacteroidota bacterium]MDP4206214.1 tRNA (5-methylaminomethyl-2-thiouridine)(34)-methyltransferase MnmD [Bacteroidota bacterium]
MKVTLTETEDGSHTLYVPEMDEHYHSTHGAIQESEHIFIQNGFLTTTAQPLQILEVGFGTGLNAWLTCNEATKAQRAVSYFTTEFYPLSPDTWEKLNYCNMHPDYDPSLFHAIHKASWEEKVGINNFFSIEKHKTDMTSFRFEKEITFDLVYYDAFAPGKQPEMWNRSIFEQIVNQMNPGAIFVTYCAKGSIRRLLTELGLKMERRPGPPGKKEILWGQKIIK